ncbi:CpsD/CapB family tyrosine-protein kinase [Paraeggerthella hongkongensis]|uniref:CpsD/CapB family tyrosine-protein kinase n=1 Tax=Paraeggerthella TaxID=651554 RepID=UPI001C0F4FA2|nr:CpsD/CapB family tyrosine-protein kinase [Paraeggerthella sp. Marseille-Q4926]MBU5405087.1 CpsD/CapB family tyrosine-protein kinase [Paraeggerthella hongkongensis]MCD2432822.1 CpsD/CapB family tyrosine-protein kinase [Paraeggerthella hominis]
MARKKKSASNALEVQNAAKTLFANIRFMSPDSPIRSIVITSSVPNEGKSTCSIELARAIATSGKTVLLVEADMRRRALADALGVRPPAGVYAVLTDAVPLSRAVAATPTPNLYFLDVEPNIPNPADIVSSKRYAKLVSLLEESYDYVVFDTPPVGTFVDAAILSTLADGTVIVVRPNLATRAELVEACEQLQKADANILGICATFCEGTDSEYYYAYYTNDGERVKRGDDAGATQGRTAADRLERIQGISRSSAEAERLRASLNGASRAASSRFRSRGDR